MKTPEDRKQPCPNSECKYYTLLNRENVSGFNKACFRQGQCGTKSLVSSVSTNLIERLNLTPRQSLAPLL